MRRQFLRRQWRDEQVASHVHLHAVNRAMLTGRPAPSSWREFDEWLVANGLRHKDYQARKKFRRAALGLSPTSANMHRAYGRAI